MVLAYYPMAVQMQLPAITMLLPCAMMALANFQMVVQM
jgi:hypothetical protein